MADIVDAMQVLVSPPTSSGTDAASFDYLFAVNIHKLQETTCSSPRLAVLADRLTFTVEGAAECNIHWRFVMCNIQLIRLLCKTLSEITEKSDKLVSAQTRGSALTNPETSAPPLSADKLSLAQRKVVSSALQFVSGFGICPLLLPGVGIPLHRRSELACKLVIQDVASGLSDCDKYYRLTAFIDILLDCLEQEELASIVLSAHLCDLLASLIQVCYAPAWKTYATEFEETRSSRKDPGLVCSHRNYVDELTKLTNQMSSSALVQELLLLQSGCPPSPNAKVLFEIRIIHFCNCIMIPNIYFSDNMQTFNED